MKGKLIAMSSQVGEDGIPCLGLDESMFEKTFEDICGFPPYPHQKQTAGYLIQNKNILLRAPTGSGKSEAIFLPFLIARQQKLPPQMIYSLPMRTLVDDVSNRFQKLAHKIPGGMRVVGHHGKRMESPLFYADVVVTTIDQTTGAYACTPLSLPLRHGNIPAGAVASSLLVFDEVHTFEPLLGLQVALILARHSAKLGFPFVFMSATMPDSFVNFMRKQYNTEFVDANENDIRVRKERKLFIHTNLNEELDAKKIISFMKDSNERIIIVCNRISKAQEIYEQIRNEALNRGFKLILLHSRFLEDDREKKEKELKEIFGTKNSNSKAILVSTQVIEVGLDITCEIMISELAPIDALIQRAGRCARRGEIGHFYVFNIDDIAPYKEQKDIITKTIKELERIDGRRLDWELEKELVNRILGGCFEEYLRPEYGARILNELAEGAFFGNRQQVERTVRETLVCDISLHDDPIALGARIFSLEKMKLNAGLLRRFVQKEKPLIWKIETDDSEEEKVIPKINVCDHRDIHPYGFYVIHPNFAYYSDELGLQLGKKGSPFDSRENVSRYELITKRNEESWNEHSQLTLTYFRNNILPYYWLPITRLADSWRIERNEFIARIELCLVLHDLGKLTVEWQKKIGRKSQPLAHSIADTGKRLPPHSTVSAYVLSDIFFDWGNFGDALRFSIAHHHGVRSREVPRYELIPEWKDEIIKVISIVDLDLDFSKIEKRASQMSSTLLDTFPLIKNEKFYRTYCIVSRILRLSDRIATAGDENAILYYENWYGNV